ncbi:MAG: hypothetical protein COV67_11590 [Nitrospinae bacterium CG11_big_fil_rev_8_21_14_0_20_56_8]|nr:MAG: hypothetical protein COV67_11590 [Nitrospinae bacterium CG11_big_fil_rev_8_21_14_0_20_56_8]
MKMSCKGLLFPFGIFGTVVGIVGQGEEKGGAMAKLGLEPDVSLVVVLDDFLAGLFNKADRANMKAPPRERGSGLRGVGLNWFWRGKG